MLPGLLIFGLVLGEKSFRTMATTPTAPTVHLKVLRREPEVATRRIPKAQREPEPEQRLWKITSEVVSPKRRFLEQLIFLFFGIVASVATTICFSQLFRLLGNDSISQLVRVLLQ